MSLPTNSVQDISVKLRTLLDNAELINRLANTTFFRNIPPAQLSLTTLEEILRSIEIIRLAKNKALEIQNADYLFEILSGYVKIYDRALLPSERGKKDIKNLPALLAWRVPGELLGDFRFLLPDEQHTDHIVATDKCQLLKIPCAMVRNLAQTYPQIYQNIASNLADKANKTRIRAQLLRLRNIEPKIAKIFIELLAERSYDDDDSIKAENPQVVKGTIRVKDIAAFLGYKYRRAQQGVRVLIKAGLIDHFQTSKSGRFVICDEQKLRDYLEREQSKTNN